MKPPPWSIFLLLVVCWALPAVAFSQAQDLTADSVFFQQQASVYQKWLDKSGLGTTLRVHTLRVEPAFVALYLQFPFSHPDSVSAAWAKLKPEFERHSPVRLEQLLFYKLTALFELPQDSAQVLIFGNYDYDAAVPNCFKRSIYFSRDSMRVQVDSSNCMSVVRDIVFDPSDFTHLKKSARLDGKDLAPARSTQPPTPDELRRRYPRQVVLDLILEFANRRFKTNRYLNNEACQNRFPYMDTLQIKHELRFEVADLCQEVIADDDPTLGGILKAVGWDVNWKRREKLIFTISYKVTPDGFTVSCLMDGLYGSGYYPKVRRGAYINMEGEFDRELEHFAEKFQVEIRKLLRDNY